MKQTRSWVACLLAVFALWISSILTNVYAVDNPTNMLNMVANQLIAKLQANQASLKANPGQVYNYAYALVVPHADLDEMARRVLPPQIWNQATPAQHAQFKQEFTKILVRTYASALAEYHNETINFYPIRGGYEGLSSVTVKSEIIRSGGPSIPVDYRVTLHGGTEWQVVDLSVEGISLLESFRSQFADTLAQGNMNSLIQQLSQHNLQNGG